VVQRGNVCSPTSEFHGTKIHHRASFWKKVFVELAPDLDFFEIIFCRNIFFRRVVKLSSTRRFAEWRGSEILFRQKWILSKLAPILKIDFAPKTVQEEINADSCFTF